jgi:hypothetical protein
MSPDPKGLDEKISRDFQQLGYKRIDDDLFAFVNIGYQGHAGQTFPKQYDADTERLLWYPKAQRPTPSQHQTRSKENRVASKLSYSLTSFWSCRLSVSSCS